MIQAFLHLRVPDASAHRRKPGERELTRRRFGAQRMCYLGSIDGWLELGHTGPVAQLARVLIPTLGTEQFYELW